MSYLGYSLVGYYPSAEMQSVYSTASLRADWAAEWQDVCIISKGYLRDTFQNLKNVKNILSNLDVRGT